MKYRIWFLLAIALGVALPLALWLHASSGDTAVPFQVMIDSLWNYNPNNVDEVIFREFRLSRTLTAMLAGSALALSGMLMQTLFQNPLAGPLYFRNKFWSEPFCSLTFIIRYFHRWCADRNCWFCITWCTFI